MDRTIEASLGASKKSATSHKKLWTSSPAFCIDTMGQKNGRAREAMRDVMWAGFLGRAVSDVELAEIDEIISSCRALSRTELASTICELFSWERPSGRLKTVECRQFLERLEAEGLLQLPARGRINPNALEIPQSDLSDPEPVLSAKVGSLSPICLQKVTTRAERQLWCEYIERYHYLGYRRPFGAHLRYFITASGATGYIGCLQFSSPAWKMAPRDRWIGWNDEQRRRNLQKIISNSRFLLLPWVRVKNMASFILARALRQVVDEWESVYGIRPVLVETLVDRERFKGTCYKAANWIHLGATTGRGRMDRKNRRQGLRPKDIHVYPLTGRFREKLLS